MSNDLATVATALNERIGIDRSVIYDFYLTGIDINKLYGQ